MNKIMNNQTTKNEMESETGTILDTLKGLKSLTKKGMLTWESESRSEGELYSTNIKINNIDHEVSLGALNTGVCVYRITTKEETGNITNLVHVTISDSICKPLLSSIVLEMERVKELKAMEEENKKRSLLNHFAKNLLENNFNNFR